MRFECLTVTGVHSQSWRGTTWRCQCDCGKSVNYETNQLLKGARKSCGCDIAIVQRFNERKDKFVELVERGPTQIKNGKHFGTWNLRCVCGTIFNVLGSNLHKIKSCGCLKNELVRRARSYDDKTLSAKNELYNRTQRRAAKYDLEFSLSRELFLELIDGDCHYCGGGHSNLFERKSRSKKRRTTASFTYNGIDRVDNKRGYVADNVVSCCKMCNLAKHANTLEDFMTWIQRVYKHNFK